MREPGEAAETLEGQPALPAQRSHTRAEIRLKSVGGRRLLSTVFQTNARRAGKLSQPRREKCCRRLYAARSSDVPSAQQTREGAQHQRFDASGVADAAAGQQRDPGGEAVQRVQPAGRPHARRRHARRARMTSARAAAARLGIEPAGRLVDEQHGRLAGHGAGERDPAARATARAAPRSASSPVSSGDERHTRRRLDRPGARRPLAREDTQQRALARAARAEQPVDLARAHIEIDACSAAAGRSAARARGPRRVERPCG